MFFLLLVCIPLATGLIEGALTSVAFGITAGISSFVLNLFLCLGAFGLDTPGGSVARHRVDVATAVAIFLGILSGIMMLIAGVHGLHVTGAILISLVVTFVMVFMEQTSN